MPNAPSLLDFPTPQIHTPDASIYAVRNIGNDGKPHRWIVQADSIQLSVPGQGLVEISISGDANSSQITLTAIGDAPDALPRSFVIRGVVVNQVRVSLETSPPDRAA